MSGESAYLSPPVSARLTAQERSLASLKCSQRQRSYVVTTTE